MLWIPIIVGVVAIGGAVALLSGGGGVIDIDRVEDLALARNTARAIEPKEENKP